MHPSLRRTALALSVSIAWPIATQAADEATVVVTATRFGGDVLEAPIGVQVISAEDIRNSGASSVAEVLHKVGGVHTRINFLGTPDLPLDLRGFGITGDQNTLVLLNGQRISENELNTAKLSGIPLNAIERIEILRGGGAVLYGGGATGGTINIITKPATAMLPTATVYAAAGSYGTSDLRASGQVAGDAWGLSLHANRYDSDNFRQNNSTTQENLTGEWRISGNRGSLALRFGSDRQRSRLPGARSEAELSSDPRGTSTPNDYAKLDGWHVDLAGEHAVGELTLAADLGYRAKASNSFSGFLGGDFLSDVDTRVVSFSPRLKWSTSPAGLTNILVAGLDWSDWDYTNKSMLTFSGFPSLTNETATQRNEAFYLQDNLHFGPATRLSAGWRHERVRLSSSESETPIPRREKTDPLNAYELSLRHNLQRGLGLFGRLGRSYRVANVDENRCFFAPCAGMLEPQKSRDREIGVEYRHNGTRLRAALFDIALTNELQFVPLVGFGGQNINLPPTRRRGVELDGGVKLSRSVELGARYAFTDASFRSGSFSGIDLAGKDVPLVPRHRASASLGWQAAAATRFSFVLSYVGEQRYDNDQANLFRKMPAYTLADAKLSHQVGDLTLAAAVNNLFDKKYYSYAIANSPTSPTTFNAYPELRRSVMLSAEFRFK